MSESQTLTRARLTELWPGPEGKLVEKGKDGGAAKMVRVQLNPQTLKVTFSNQNAGGDQPKGSSVQFVGTGTTKLSVELVFDVSRPVPPAEGDRQEAGQGGTVDDVRVLTKDVAYFITPQKTSVKITASETKEGLLPPGVRLQWGTFLFEGVMESLDETLDLFSADGRPLRSTLALSISKQEIQFEFGERAGAGGAGAGPTPGQGGGIAGGTPGISPLHTPKAGESLQQTLGRTGQGDWQSVALANGIENPRHLTPGVPLQLFPR